MRQSLGRVKDIATYERCMPALRVLSPLSWILLIAGGIVLGRGLWLFDYYSPSPHMLLEIAIALPLIGLGGVLLASGVLVSRQRLPEAATVGAAVALTLSLLPLGLWALLVGMAWVSAK
jgi:hypothetical protein